MKIRSGWDLLKIAGGAVLLVLPLSRAAAEDDFTLDVSAFLKSPFGTTAVKGERVFQELYVDEDGVDVYKEPRLPVNETDARDLVLTQLNRGEKVELIGKSRDGEWYQVAVVGLEWDSEVHALKKTPGWVTRRRQVARRGQAPQGAELPPIPAGSEIGAELFVSAPPVATKAKPALPSKPANLKPSACREAFAATLLGFLGTPYLWGGTSIWGVDCSGLVVASMQQAKCVKNEGIPRTAAAQQSAAKKLDDKSQLQIGDLIFFHRGGRVAHVAAYLGNGVVIESPSKGKSVMTSNLEQRIAGRNVSFGSLLPKLEK